MKVFSCKRFYRDKSYLSPLLMQYYEEVIINNN
jgi:hypothetical protein